MCYLEKTFARMSERKKINRNVGKTLVLKFSFSGEQTPLRVRLALEELQEVNELKFFGSYVPSYCGMETELK